MTVKDEYVNANLTPMEAVRQYEFLQHPTVVAWAEELEALREGVESLNEQLDDEREVIPIGVRKLLVEARDKAQRLKGGTCLEADVVDLAGEIGDILDELLGED